MNELALFAGAGGGILGGKLLGWRTICAVEWEAYPASVLCARQNDGIFPPFPVWDDVQTFDAKPWAGIVDVVSGGFPCTDISAAGKGAGIDGEQSGMWREMARVICEVRPGYVFVENSPMLTSRGLGRVLGDLASMGFDAKWGVLGAKEVGANHQRDRIWIVSKWRGQLPHTQHNRIRRWEQQQESIKETTGNVANTNGRMCGGWRAIEQGGENRIGGIHTQEAEQAPHDVWGETFGCGFVRAKENNVAYPDHKGLQRKEWGWSAGKKGQPYGYASERDWWQFEPGVGRVADGVAARVHRLKAIGNGQVPLCAATAWRILTER